MSNKINVINIIKDHVHTFSDASGKPCAIDYICFIIIPIVLAGISIYFRYDLSSDATAALINFGAITTALLLSVLVLVFDQDRKLQAENDPFYGRKKTLFKELYSNICYSVIMSIALVAACLLNIIFGNFSIEIQKMHISAHLYLFFAPLIIFVSANLILTILMVTKRMYAVLMINYNSK